MKVHNELGPGLREIHYHRALSAQLAEEGLGFEEERRVQVELNGDFAGLLYMDHLVEGTVVVEEKALNRMLTNVELAQVITYLAATDMPVGLLLNFGRPWLEYKRVLPPRKVEEWRGRVRRYLWDPSRANSGIRS